jgi:hypothetical protein
MAKQMGHCGALGHGVTGLRWRDRAEEHRQQRQTLGPGRFSRRPAYVPTTTNY